MDQAPMYIDAPDNQAGASATTSKEEIMGNKLNAKESKVSIDDLKKRKDGDKEQLPLTMSEGEKVQLAVLLEKISLTQEQLRQYQIAASELVATIVKSRGLDPKEYGVNLAAGQILPVASGASKGKGK